MTPTDQTPTDPIRDEAVKVLAEAEVRSTNAHQHSQLCPVWVDRLKKPDPIEVCDCWVKGNAPYNAAKYLDASPTLARRLALGTAWDAAPPDIMGLASFARHRTWCPEDDGSGDCICGLYALLETFQCVCGHKVSVHTTRDVSDVVGWPCNGCRSDRCAGFALAALAAKLGSGK